MSRITPIHWKKFRKFLKSIGCTFVRQRGDHLIFRKKGINRPIVFPRDAEVPEFIIRNNLRVLGIDREEYLCLIKDI